jgi:hypothetical protein
LALQEKTKMKKIMLMLLVSAFAFPAVCFPQSNDWRRPFYSTADYLRDMKATTQRYSKVVDNYTSWLDSHFSYKPPTQVIYYDEPYYYPYPYYQPRFNIKVNVYQTYEENPVDRLIRWSQAASPTTWSYPAGDDRPLPETPFCSYYDKSTSTYIYSPEAGSEPVKISLKSGSDPDKEGLILLEKIARATVKASDALDECTTEEIMEMIKDYSDSKPEIIPLLHKKLLEKYIEEYKKKQDEHLAFLEWRNKMEAYFMSIAEKELLTKFREKMKVSEKKMMEEKEKAEDLAFLEKEGFVTPARRAQLLEYIKKTNFLSLSFLFF